MEDKKKNPDGSYTLISLIGKPKAWREEASKVLIKQENKIKRLDWKVSAVIGLTVTILGLLIKMALGA